MLAPHRMHLYQRLANGGWGHGRVTLLYLAVAALGAVLALALRHTPPLLLVASYGAAVSAAGVLLERVAPYTREPLS
jgi:hypothetical protein